MMLEKKSRSRVIAAALLALAFIAGTAAGVAADRLLTPKPIIRERITRDMSGVLDKLALTPQQRVQADAIIQRSAPRTETAMLEVAERLRTVSDSVDAELRAILTTEQRTRLDSLRRQPLFMLKRKTQGSATKVDTVFPYLRDSIKRVNGR
jgi:Spy/CpxP family protein refolding chaperone